MIVTAGLLVLLGLGLFVAGVLTGMTALYWACVAACVVAAVLLVLARRQLSAASPTAPSEPARTTAPEAATAKVRAPEATAPETTAPEATAPETTAPETTAPETTAPEAAAPEATAPEATAPTAAGAASTAEAAAGTDASEDPPVEEVEVTDLLLVVDLQDEVLVIDEHPRYHLPGCPHLADRPTIPLPLDEARTDGFTPCAVCAPDRHLAQRARERRAAG